MDAEKQFEHAGYLVSIYQDTNAQSPEDWGNDDLFLVTTRNRYFEVNRAGFDLDSIRDGEHASGARGGREDRLNDGALSLALRPSCQMALAENLTERI
jgi:hypothetical protein